MKNLLVVSRDSALLEAAADFCRRSEHGFEVRPAPLDRIRSGEIPEFTVAVIDARGGVPVDSSLVEALARRRRGAPLPLVLLGGEVGPADSPMSLVRLPAETAPAALFEIVGLAVEWGEQADEVRFLRKEVGLLRTLHGLFGQVDLDGVYSRIVEAMTDLLGLPFGYLLVWDETRGRYLRRFAGDARHRDGSAYVPVLSKEEIDGVIASGETHRIVERSWTDPQEQIHRSHFLLLPMRSRLRRIGCAKFPVTEAEAASLDLHRVASSAGLLSEIAAVVDNLMFLHETRELTIKDDLTKAYNRRYFESFVDEEIERARRYRSRFSLIFLDLDNLKNVNNLWGHLIGSRTLQEVGKRIISAVRGVDRVARFGGDEFCIILPQTDEAKARRVAERVRTSISGETYRLGPGIEIAMTASFGIATWPVHASTKDELVKAADRAMYEVKGEKKNSVRVAGPRSPEAEEPITPDDDDDLDERPGDGREVEES